MAAANLNDHSAVMDVHFEKRLLRQANGTIMNASPRASRNLFGASPGGGSTGAARGTSPSSIHSPAPSSSPSSSVSSTTFLSVGGLVKRLV